MANFDFNSFLNILNDKQRTAVLACRTEDEFEQVIDDFDIQIPDELLEDVAGGKGFAPVAIAAILAFTGGISAGIAMTGNVSADADKPAAVMETEHIRTEAIKETTTTTTTISGVENVQQVKQTAEKDTEVNNGKHYGEMGYGYAE